MNLLLMVSCSQYNIVINIFLCKSLTIGLIGLRQLDGSGLGLCRELMLLWIGLAC